MTVPLYKNLGIRISTRSGERWLPAHTDQHERVRDHGNPVVSLLMPIGTFHHAAAQSVMKVNVSESYFLEPLRRIHLAENSTIFLLGEQGNPILSQQVDTLGGIATAEIDRIPKQPTQIRCGIPHEPGRTARHPCIQETGTYRLDVGRSGTGKGNVPISP
ncbi:hypothetical protein Q0F98_32940 [Paenibacillus amylolyticus]|nr:hypothetical protein Q0F98_32940 [Paenibacillus amylolyticus]